MLKYFAPVLTALTITCVFAGAANADAISPAIRESGTKYSSEKPNKAYYGTGVSSRMTEASELRFQGEQDIEDAKFDDAIRKLAKAVQLDPGDPEGHLLYARALTKKIDTGKGVTQDMVAKAKGEWGLLWHHDADYSEQFEAKMSSRHVAKVAKALAKQAKRERKQSQIAAANRTTNNPK